MVPVGGAPGSPQAAQAGAACRGAQSQPPATLQLNRTRGAQEPALQAHSAVAKTDVRLKDGSGEPYADAVGGVSVQVRLKSPQLGASLQSPSPAALQCTRHSSAASVHCHGRDASGMQGGVPRIEYACTLCTACRTAKSFCPHARLKLPAAPIAAHALCGLFTMSTPKTKAAASATAAAKPPPSSKPPVQPPAQDTKAKGEALERRVAATLARLGKPNIRTNVLLRDANGNLSEVDVVYGRWRRYFVECKAYAPAYPVPLDDVAKFKEVMSLHGVPLRRGLFVTTSSYSPRALTAGIKTLDGKQLAAWEAYSRRVRTLRRGAWAGIGLTCLGLGAIVLAPWWAADKYVDAPAGEAGTALQAARRVALDAHAELRDATARVTAAAGATLDTLRLLLGKQLEEPRPQSSGSGGTSPLPASPQAPPSGVAAGLRGGVTHKPALTPEQRTAYESVHPPGSAAQPLNTNKEVLVSGVTLLATGSLALLRALRNGRVPPFLKHKAQRS